LTINVFVSEQTQTVTIMIPYCPQCFDNMELLSSNVAPPPPGYEGLASPEQQYMDVGSMNFFCPRHPNEQEYLNREQIDTVNKYPIARQFFKQTMRFNRKDRRKKRH
jgi:hypothetical protein